MNTSLRSLAATAAFALVAVTAHAQTIVQTVLVDFGGTASASPWNNINGGAQTGFLVNTAAGTTTFKAQATGWSGFATVGGVPTATGFTGSALAAFGSSYPEAAQDYVFSTTSGATGKVTFTGLDATVGTTYTLTIFAARNSTNNNYTNTFTATGLNSASGTLNASLNTGNVLVLSGISATALGSLELSVQNLGNSNIYLNAIKLEQVSASAVPEPASFAALAGVSTLGLAALRRRRR